MRSLIAIALTCLISLSPALAQRYTDAEGHVRVAVRGVKIRESRKANAK